MSESTNPILSGVIKRGNLRTSAVNEQLDSDSRVIIQDSVTGEEISIPERFLIATADMAVALTNVHRMRTEKQLEYSDILGRHSGLVGRDLNRKILVEGDELEAIDTPILSWVSSTQENLNLKNDSTEKRVKVSGWKLYLKGCPEEALGFAEWNDLSRIDSFIQKMKSKELLTATLALSSPEKGGKIASGLALKEFVGTDRLPSMTLLEVRRKLKTHYTRKAKSGVLAPLVVSDGNAEHIIAVAAAKNVGWNTAGASLSAANEITPLMTGWHRVLLSSMPDEGKIIHRRYRNMTDAIWFTKIPPEEWSSLAPGLGAVAKLGVRRGSF